MTPVPDTILLARRAIEEGRIASLEVSELVKSDLPSIGWSGSASHIESVGEQLRRPPNEVEYLCVRAPSGEPIAKAGVDYAAHPGSGTVWQVAVHPGLQGLGLGQYLIEAAENRIRARGLIEARIGVEDDNEDALRLYLRLGYIACGRWESSWPAIDEAGRSYEHHATGTDLTKPL